MRVSERDLKKHFKATARVLLEEYKDMSDSKTQSIVDQLLCLRIFMRRVE